MLRDLLVHEERHKLVQSQSLALPQDHTGAHALAQNWIGHRNAGYVLHGWMSQNKVLDFLGTDFLSATVDKILLPSLDHIIPGRMTPHQIARTVKPIGRERPGIVLWNTEVSPERVGPARQ